MDALLCVLLVAAAILLIWPVVENGILDDFSYIRTAELLARTGHIQYNGWATAMLGWPLYVAAAAMRLFGPSFTMARLTTMLEALVAVYLLHRVLVRAGVRRWHAILGTLTVSLSPIFLVASTSFMSDIPGLLAFLVCLYACLRALHAADDRHAAHWLVFAAVGNAGLGTCRQIAWLGVLVMVPSALVLLRSRRAVLKLVVPATVLCWLFIAWCLHWFSHQPYTLPEPLLRAHLSPLTALRALLVSVVLRVGLDAVLLALPVAVAFWPALTRDRLLATKIAVLCAAVVTLSGIWIHFHDHGTNWLPPFLLYPPADPQAAENTFTSIQMPIKGVPPLPLGIGFQAACMGVLFVGVVCMLTAAFAPRVESGTDLPTLRELFSLLIPFAIAYCGLLLPRGLFIPLFDRYLLILIPALLPLALRWMGSLRIQPSGMAFSFLAVFALYGICTTHDFFSTYRANAAAIEEMRQAGVPRTAIDGGWEYNLYTEILITGYVSQPGLRLPGGRQLAVDAVSHDNPCATNASWEAPHVRARFALAYPVSQCLGASEFPPVSYRTWLPPFQRTILPVHYVP